MADEMNFGSFDNQIIYKLAAIETKINGLVEKLDGTVARLELRISDMSKDCAADMSKLEARIETLDKEVTAMKRFRDNVTAKIGGIVSVVTIFWMLFGNVLSDRIKGLF